MKTPTIKAANRLLVLLVGFWILSGAHTGSAQDIRWLRVGELQSPINEVGAEYETEFNFPGGNSNFFSWPAQYGINQNVTRMKGLWIGCKNFDDPVEGKIKSVKVIGAGPKAVATPDVIFPQEIKLVGKYPRPSVIVDEASASALEQYDLVDEYDENLPCDRMVLVRFNTSMGVSVTKKVMAFSQSDQGSYFINDYVFKNTGIVNAAGSTKQQTLDSVWVYFHYRYALGGETVTGGSGSTWGAFSSTWGASTLNHAIGENPNAPEFTNPSSPLYQLRAFYSWYGPQTSAPRPPYDEDWGCPNLDENGIPGSAKYAGCVTLHADTSPQNQTDDPNQPRTTWYISPDIPINSNTSPSQYDEVYMSDRWAAITEGHPSQQHDEVVGNDYAQNYTDSRRQSGGGTAMGQGYGPYRLAPGDSIRIVFAEGVSGISWEKSREVGANWFQWRNGTGQPPLIMPNGSQEPSNYNEYKRAWVVEAGRDSILKTFRNARNNYNSGYTLPQPPPPPSEFKVTGGGDRIRLTWANNAVSHPHFGGYVIYRSEGNVADWRTAYEKIFETNDPNANSFDDVTARRGFDYYYYIQARDDGTQVPGTTLYSSMFWTLASVGAVLGRPASAAQIDSVSKALRIVPNPYDIRARLFQFGDQSQYDRIAFYGLPPSCALKIFTERGDLIWEKEHTRPTGDEIWDSTTSSGQIIASGIYILYVELPGGEAVHRKFIVIR
jgi:hypothetical protein